MPDELIPLEIPKALANLNDNAQTDVAAVIAYIADQCLSPAQPGEMWAGRDEVVRWVIGEKGIGPQEADALVSEAQAQLWAQTREDDSHVQRELMLSRLRVLRRKVQAAIDQPQIEMRYNWEDSGRIDSEGKPIMRRKPFREKIITGPHGGWVRMALLIEGMIGEVMGARKSSEDESVDRLLEIIQQSNAGGETIAVRATEKRGGGGTAKMLNGLSPESAKNLLAKVRQSKPVEATVVNAGE